MEMPSTDKITIIEGPPPTFEHPPEAWALSLAEGPVMPHMALTRLRTFNGPSMVERCWKAWDDDRPIHLEYRDEDGLTRQAPIMGVRFAEVDEGHVLLLYVRLN